MQLNISKKNEKQDCNNIDETPSSKFPWTKVHRNNKCEERSVLKKTLVWNKTVTKILEEL